MMVISATTMVMLVTTSLVMLAIVETTIIMTTTTTMVEAMKMVMVVDTIVKEGKWIERCYRGSIFKKQHGICCQQHYD